MARMPDVDAFANQPVVIDNGSGLMKAGFAAAEMPKLIFPTYVGRPKHLKVMAGAAAGDIFVGEKAKELRGILKLTYPMKNGSVLDWEDMHQIWSHIYSELDVAQDQHPVLLTEAPLNPKGNRSKSAELFFESFNVPSLYVQNQSILSLYASGRTTGVVIDSGEGCTSIVPVFEGFALPHSIERMDVGGRNITEYLNLLLKKNGVANFHTSAEMETVRDIKEKLCYVAFKAEINEHAEEEHSEVYTLPDGNTLKIGNEKSRAPEILFNPSLIGLEYSGIPQLLCNSISRSDLDIRRSLFSNIMLAGGSTLFDGFGDRLLLESRKLAPKDTKVKIWAPPERILSSWIGGSILASLATFKQMWVTRKEWEESGKSILFRKMF